MRVRWLAFSLIIVMSCSKNDDGDSSSEDAKEKTLKKVVLSSAKGEWVEVVISPNKKRMLENLMKFSEQPTVPDLLEYFGLVFSESSEVSYSPEADVIYIKGDEKFIYFIENFVKNLDQDGVNDFRKSINKDF